MVKDAIITRLNMLKKYNGFAIAEDPVDNSYTVQHEKSDIKAVFYMNGAVKYYIDSYDGPFEIDIKQLDLLRELVEMNKGGN